MWQYFRGAGQVGIATDKGLILKHIRNARLELSIFTVSISTIAQMLKQSTGSDILCDSKTYGLCPQYFSAKELENKTYSIVSLSN